MPVTINDVARMAAVSPGTVSNVLNGRRSQEDVIATAVFRAVKTLNYRVNEAASNLRLRQSRIIGMVVPDLRNPFFSRLIDSAQRIVGLDGYRLFVTSSRESVKVEIDEIASFVRWKVAGLLVAPSGDGRRYRKANALDEVPCVILDRVPSGCAFDSVSVDDAAACTAGIERLANTGHRRILLTYVDTKAPNLALRIDACERAADRLGLELLRESCPAIDSPEAQQLSDHRIARVLNRKCAPDALFSLSIITTRQALRVLGQSGRRIPEDVSLLGFDDSQWLESLHPGIDAIAQPVEAMAEAGWQALVARLQTDLRGSRKGIFEGDHQESVSDRSCTHTVLDCEARWRGSVQQS